MASIMSGIYESKKQKRIIAAFAALFFSVFAYLVACSFLKDYKPQMLNEVDSSDKFDNGFFENAGIYNESLQRTDFSYVGSYLNNDYKAEYKSGWYYGDGDILLWVQGYADNDNIQLFLELDNGKRLECDVYAQEEWTDYLFRIWRKHNFRIVAVDNATGGFDWVAFSTVPIRYGWKYVLAKEYIVIFKVLCMLALVFCWMVPGYVIVLSLLHNIERKECVHIYVFFTLAIVSTLFYWIRVYTMADMKTVIRLAWIVVFLFAFMRRRAIKESIKEMHLIKEVIFLFLVASFYLMILYVYDLQNGYDFLNFGRRFFETQDNEFQLELVKRLVSYEDYRDPLLGWQTSDRPHLLAAMFYTISVWVPKSMYTDLYLAQGTLLNLSAFTVVFYFMRELNFCENQIKYLLILITFNSTVCMNMIFTWPKFLSSTFFGIGLILLYQWYMKKELSYKEQCVVGASIALAMTAHGSIAFAIIGLGLVLLLGKHVRWKNVLLIVVSFAIVYAPWMIYQKVMDPPGDILLRFFLGGVWTNNGNTLFEQLIDSYKALTIRQWSLNKLSNFIEYFYDIFMPKNNKSIISWYWNNKWATLFFTLGINNISILITILFRKRLNKTQKYLVCTFAMSLLVHALIYFKAANTIIHHCAYSNMIILFILVASLAREIKPKTIYLMNVVNIFDILLTLIIKPELSVDYKSYAERFYSLSAVGFLGFVVGGVVVLLYINKYSSNAWLEKESYCSDSAITSDCIVAECFK